MPIQKFTQNSLPVSLKNKPIEIQQLFVEKANECIDAGMNISQSIEVANKTANEAFTKLQKEIEKSLLLQKEENKIKAGIKEQIKKSHNLLLKQALDYIGDEEDNQEQEELVKAASTPKKIISTEFDKQGKLVTIFDDGSRIVSKNNAPADKIDQTVAVSINPVFDYVRFNTTADSPPWEEGLLFWDKTDHSLAYYNDEDDVTLNIGREELVRVFNNTGVLLNDGMLVYISGAVAGWPTVSLAKADTSPSSQSIIGMVTSHIAPGTYGYVCTSGVVNGLNTSMYSAGDVLYLSESVAGGYTKVKPLQPNYNIEIGTVLFNDSTNGRIYVNIDKKAWFPSLELIETTASITLPLVPTVFKPSITNYNDGFGYDPLTGIISINNSSTYSINILFNALPSASNKNIYFYAEEDTGSGWQIRRYSARKLELVNAQEQQVIVTASRYYPIGSKLRLYIWGDSTIYLKSTDLPGTTPGTVTLPAYRYMMA